MDCVRALPENLREQAIADVEFGEAQEVARAAATLAAEATALAVSCIDYGKFL